MTLAHSTLLHHFVDRALARFPDKPAVISAGKTHSYRDVSERANRIAGALQQGGVKRGDRVMILLENGIEVVASIFGILRAGGVFMVLNPQTKKDKLAYVLENSGSSALISSETLAAVYDEPVAQSADCKLVLTLGLAADTTRTGKPYRSLEQ
ncbi:MAG: class I adenylate-forming enzyme family protein, partial [Steroidobacteraceae bacterium]